MKYLKALFDFYINSSLHVALAIVALTRLSELELDIPIEKNFYGFIFFGSITGYNFVKYAALAGLHHRHLTHSLRAIQSFSLVCFVAFIYFAFQFDWQFLLYCLPLGLLTLLYAVPFLPQKRNLRMIPTLKIFIIATVWAGVTVYLPTIYNAVFNQNAQVINLQRILLVLALMVPFEIRDLNYDEDNLGTLPQILGIKKTKQVGLLLLGFILVLEVLKTPYTLSLIVPHLLILILTGYAIIKASTQQSRYYASFFTEGIPILWLLLVLIFSQFTS